MKVFVQQDTTELYLGGLGSWVPDSHQAMVFHNRTSAFLFCIRYYLSGVHVVVQNDQGEWEAG